MKFFNLVPTQSQRQEQIDGKLLYLGKIATIRSYMQETLKGHLAQRQKAGMGPTLKICQSAGK